MAAALCAALVALPACTTPGPIHVTPQPGTPSGTTAISKVAQDALFAAEAAYNVPAHVYVTLDHDGALPADVKFRVKPVLQAAYQALGAARAAARIGDSLGVLASAAQATERAETAKSLLPAQ
jgi:hypothetical protein